MLIFLYIALTGLLYSLYELELKYSPFGLFPIAPELKFVMFFIILCIYYIYTMYCEA
jgi:hypothetical protein